MRCLVDEVGVRRLSGAAMRPVNRCFLIEVCVFVVSVKTLAATRERPPVGPPALPDDVAERAERVGAGVLAPGLSYPGRGWSAARVWTTIGVPRALSFDAPSFFESE
ncbi:hypothetical protein WS45_09010 [Burkholderia sp. RF2-non_BP3]|nr:hypothetical protein WS45_09010 [Burkholderia sp. RF2-non_BP3]